MTASLIFLFAVLCISIALCAYLFYSIPYVNRVLRTKEKQFFDARLLLITFFFYVIIFTALESIFLYQEGFSLFAVSWQLQSVFFTVVTALVLCALRLSAGNLLISAPQFYVEKVVPLYGDFEEDSALFLELIADFKGEVVLDALDKKIIIARVPLVSFEGSNSSEEVMVECTFSESFLKDTLVQLVCYPASRGVFIEKTTMNRVLEYFEHRYAEKILKSLS